MEDIDKQKVVEEILAKKNKKKQNVEQYKDELINLRYQYSFSLEDLLLYLKKTYKLKISRESLVKAIPELVQKDENKIINKIVKDFLSLSKEGQEKVVRTIAQLTAEQHAEQHYT